MHDTHTYTLLAHIFFDQHSNTIHHLEALLEVTELHVSPVEDSPVPPTLHQQHSNSINTTIINTNSVVPHVHIPHITVVSPTVSNPPLETNVELGHVSVNMVSESEVPDASHATVYNHHDAHNDTNSNMNPDASHVTLYNHLNARNDTNSNRQHFYHNVKIQDDTVTAIAPSSAVITSEATSVDVLEVSPVGLVLRANTVTLTAPGILGL